MSLLLIEHLMVAGSVLMLSIGTAQAQTPPSETMVAARSLVTALKLTERYKALLPAILLSIKPTPTQDRPEIESDFEARKPLMMEAYTPYYNAVVDGIASFYAANFTVEEPRVLEAFFCRPAGQKFLEKLPEITQQSIQIGEDGSRRAAEGLRTSLTEVLRQKAPK